RGAVALLEAGQERLLLREVEPGERKDLLEGLLVAGPPRREPFHFIVIVAPFLGALLRFLAIRILALDGRDAVPGPGRRLRIGLSLRVDGKDRVIGRLHTLFL